MVERSKRFCMAGAAWMASLCLATVVWLSVGQARAAESVPHAGVAAEGLDFESDGPATFGQVFGRGDFPDAAVVGKNGGHVDYQLDRLASWPDGSLKFARISVLKKGDYAIRPRSLGSGGDGSGSSTPALPEIDFKVVVQLADGGVLSGTLQGVKGHYGYGLDRKYSVRSGDILDLYALPATPLTYSDGKVSPSLSLRAWVWYYPTLHTSQIVATVENDWAQTATRNVTAKEIRFLLNGKAVFAQRDVTIYRWSRTRPVRVWSGEVVGDHVKRNLSYLRSTGAVPNYDPHLQLARNVFAEYEKQYKDSPRGIMGHTVVNPHMGDTGGRPEIGPLPKWAALAVLSNDPRALSLSRKIDSSAAPWPVHLRDSATGGILSIAKYPQASVYPTLLRGMSGRTRNNPVPCWENDCKQVYPKTGIPLQPNQAHAPGWAYVSYLLTADPFYLEEMEFWANWTLLKMNPGYRQGAKGIFFAHNQLRTMAWSLRTLGYLYFILPRTSADHRYFGTILENNRLWAMKHWVEADKFPEHVVKGAYGRGKNGDWTMAPWMDDFLTWSLGNMTRLGFSQWDALAKWKAQFVVHRVQGNGVCPSFASIYNVYYIRKGGRPVGMWADMVKSYVSSNYSGEKATAPCGSRSFAKAYALPKPGDFLGYPWSAQGFPANMQPALAAAADLGVVGAQAAWSVYANRPTKQEYSAYPNWDVVPSHAR